ncbi:type II secretion system protein [Cupriavidus metallidurans]|uniref:type II secretion system protein n=1 Tax=Cupriavidus metallidurans TaxID=119219 RepID=UPI001CCEB317|nr:type II secretion system protein [Cupriavidus metallidurans]UBM08037.1 type II secretion system protein [Cupriavidus metallidurans]
MSPMPSARLVRGCLRRRRGQGLVLLSLLIALLLMAIAMEGALDVWALQRQRQMEEELLFVGEQYRQAIQSYYLVGRALPASIDDLLEDKRFPVPLHHLRRAYPDPMTGKADWKLLIEGGRIYGVYSGSTAETIKRARFPRRYAEFANAKTYAEWQFFYVPPGRGIPGTNPGPQTPAPNTRGGKGAVPGNGNRTSPFAPLRPGG